MDVQNFAILFRLLSHPFEIIGLSQEEIFLGPLNQRNQVRLQNCLARSFSLPHLALFVLLYHLLIDLRSELLVVVVVPLLPKEEAFQVGSLLASIYPIQNRHWEPYLFRRESTYNSNFYLPKSYFGHFSLRFHR